MHQLTGSKQWLRFFFLLMLICLTGCAGIRNSLYEKAMAHERKKAGLALKTIDAGGKTISLLESAPGEKRPTIVMVHGFAANKENWVRFAAHLTEAYHVVAMDLPGHGESEKDFSLNYDFREQAGFVNEILTRLNIDRFHMAGNSMGGAIAALYAANYPDQVTSLFLIDPAGIHQYESELSRRLEGGENPLIVREKDDFYELMDFALEQKPFMPWPIISVMAEKYVANESINRKIFADFYSSADYSIESELKKITAPAFILWGAQDRIIHVKNADVFHELIPDSRMRVLDNVGHAPMIEVPEETAEIYLNFIHSLSEIASGEDSAGKESL
jgi:pimeloyl-ACP methyl ester carboxylesterase